MQTIAVMGNDIYVGGSFTIAGGVAAGAVARWDGSAWSSVKSGTTELVGGTVYALAATNSGAYFAGSFSHAGGQVSFGLAHAEFPAVSTGIGAPIEAPVTFGLDQNYPNPFNPKTVVSSQLPVASDVKLVVYDMLGREVAVLVNERRGAGSYRDGFDGSGLASGAYIYRLTAGLPDRQAGSFVQTMKMILLK